MQSMSENDFECFASTGVKSPTNAVFEHTNTRYPQIIARRMVSSWEWRRPMEKRQDQPSLLPQVICFSGCFHQGYPHEFNRLKLGRLTTFVVKRCRN